MNRQARANIAKQTCEILETGTYTNSQGHTISIEQFLNNAVRNSMTYWQNDEDKIQELMDAISKSFQVQNCKIDSIIEVMDETSLRAAKRLKSEGYEKVVCLNFASAKNPGGGFLGGSQAQEESLARASGLYTCQTQNSDMYEDNRRQNSTFYSDHMMYSPNVPVFRDDNDSLLDEPYIVSFITAPAVNLGLVQKRNPELVEQVEQVMKHRIERVLSIGLIHENEAIVLGAWGCGVFQNDPLQIAKIFAQFVLEDERFVNRYRKIVFAIPAGRLSHLEVFQNQFNV